MYPVKNLFLCRFTMEAVTQSFRVGIEDLAWQFSRLRIAILRGRGILREPDLSRNESERLGRLDAWFAAASGRRNAENR